MSQQDHETTPPAGPPHDTRTETHSEPAPGAGGADGSGHGVGHADTAGHDEHGHDEEPLGPVDVWPWGAGALGILVAAVMVLCFAMATAPIA